MIRACVAAFSISSVFVSQQPASRAPSCQPTGAIVRLQQLPEASGIAASRGVPGRFWTHKDSGQPLVFALDARGVVDGQIAVPGAKVDDWEAVAVGPCSAGSCVYVGDIGDKAHDASRSPYIGSPNRENSSKPRRLAMCFTPRIRAEPRTRKHS